MANMSIKYEIAKHATANPSNVLSGGTYGGHMFSILLGSDADNGNLIAVGDWDSHLTYLRRLLLLNLKERL